MKNCNYEILSPAGSVEQLQAAVNNGCDSVYLGLDSFNARIKAPNFTAENLAQWVDYCHFFGVKVFVAVNTSVKNSEFLQASKAIFTAYKCNADGVIVTDLALLKFAASLPAPFEVVASTQLNIHDGFGARFARELGASTVVCARESSLEEVKQIVAEVRTECFLHGALCVCQSGQCLLSSMVGGNSGNRGLCAQPCRKFYKSNVGNFTNGGYLLSAADICGLDNDAKTLFESGVHTFKIEGRNRRPEYAGATAKVYSKMFANGFLQNSGSKVLLEEMFNRGNLPSNRYLAEHNDGIIFPYAQNHIGVVVGTVKGNGVQTQVRLAKGDGLKVFAGENEVCGGVVLQSGTGFVLAEFSQKVQDGMTVRRTTSVELCNEILAEKRTRTVSMRLIAKVGQRAVLTLTSQDVSISVKSADVLPLAKNSPTASQEMAQQLRKIGVLQYTITDIVIENDNIFFAKSQINALRRLAFEKLTQAVVDSYNSKFSGRATVDFLHFAHFCNESDSGSQNCLAVCCESTEQVLQLQGKVDYILFKPQVLNEQVLNELQGTFCFVDLPSFADNIYVQTLLNGKNLGIVCHNVGQVQLAREQNIPYIAGTGLNIFNDNIANIFYDAQTFFYSQELTLSEISAFSHKNGLTFVDGKLVLMKLVHCPFKVVFGGDCSNCQAHRTLTYTDELGNVFEIKRRRDKRCTFELVNGKKLSVVSKLNRGGRFCVDYNEDVIRHYLAFNNGQVDGYQETADYTKGRLFNKIN